MDQQQTRKDHLANAAKSRSMAKERQAERAAEIAGKQAQLKREAQERREQKLKPRRRTKSDAVPGRLRNSPRLALRRSGLGGAASHLVGLALCGSVPRLA
jgi:hypothetical protein